jgi:hypothetical protein
MMEKCGFVLTKKEIIDFGSELASASQEIEGSITLSDSWYIADSKVPVILFFM